MQIEAKPQGDPLVVQVGASRWLSHHLHWRGDRDPILWHVARPVLATLLAEEAIDSFFFIRYGEGGEHVRLRLRLAPEVAPEGAGARAHGLLSDAMAAWQQSLDDPGHADDQDRIRRAPFELEIQRYGGDTVFPCSLDFFAISSVNALDFVRAWSGQPRGRQLPEIMGRLICQAFALARDDDELVHLLDYYEERRATMPQILTRADQMFEARTDGFVQRFQDTLTAAMQVGEPPWDAPAQAARQPESALIHGARCLSLALAGTGDAARRQVARSQMHMTANRLGLKNPEEAYLTQILHRCAGAVRERSVGFWDAAADYLRRRPGGTAAAAAAALAALAPASARAFLCDTASGTTDAQEERP